MYAANQIEDEELKAKLPKPTGYHVLIAVPEMSTKTDGGVIMPDALVKQEETASIIGYVLALGPEAYADSDKIFKRTLLCSWRFYYLPVVFRHTI
jgi:hypothetical protein